MDLSPTMEVSKAIMRENRVSVTSIRAVDHDIAFGVYPDMREHGFNRDDWPVPGHKKGVALRAG